MELKYQIFIDMVKYKYKHEHVWTIIYPVVIHTSTVIYHINTCIMLYSRWTHTSVKVMMFIIYNCGCFSLSLRQWRMWRAAATADAPPLCPRKQQDNIIIEEMTTPLHIAHSLFQIDSERGENDFRRGKLYTA